MNIIKNNPFRILGLPANSTEKEIQKNIKTLKRFAEVGKSKEFDFDFSFFGEFSRNVDTVQEASNRIEQMPKKIQNALFWFTNNNRVDETALNYLKDNDIEKAIEIWQKTLKNEITEKNYSSYANLSTLLIGVSSVNGSVKKDLLKQGLELKGKLLNSNNIKDFVSTISGNGHICNTEKLNSEFTSEILQLVKPYLKNKELTQREFVSYFSVFPANVQKSVLAKFSETHVFNIEKSIENTVKIRTETPRDAEEYGEELYKNTQKDIAELKKIFGKDNIQFQMIANKLANEILQCSIDFFNTHREEDGEFDPGDDALKIAKYANSVGASGQVKNRIIENTQSIQEWVDSKEEREKQKNIEEDLEFITTKLQRFQNISENIENARDLVSSCKPKLLNVKKELGYNNELYLHLSSAVANNALGMVINVVNREQEALQYDKRKIISLPTILSNAVSAINLIGSLDMVSEIRTRYNTNKTAINSIDNQISAISKQVINAVQNYSSSSSLETWASENPGCLIAIIIGIIIFLISIFAN